MLRGSLFALAFLTGGCAASRDDAARSTATGAAVPPAREPPAIVVEPFGPQAPPPPTEPFRVLVGGDLIPHRPSLAAPSAVLNALAPLASVFGKADAVVANYEAATGELEK